MNARMVAAGFAVIAALTALTIGKSIRKMEQPGGSVPVRAAAPSAVRPVSDAPEREAPPVEFEYNRKTGQKQFLR